MTKDTPRPKRGRPKRPAEEAIEEGRVHIGLYVKPEMRDALDTAARAAGITRSKEVEARLRASFEPQGSLERALDAAYGPQISGVLLMLGKAMVEIANVKKDWFDDQRFFEQAVEAINVILGGLAPKEEPNQHDLFEETPGERELISRLGWDIGGWILVRARGLPHYVGAPGSWSALVGERLGYDVRSRIELPRESDRSPRGGKLSPPTPAADSQPSGGPDTMDIGEIVEVIEVVPTDEPVEGKDPSTPSRARHKVVDRVAKRQA